jgi:hypothetical protein
LALIEPYGKIASFGPGVFLVVYLVRVYAIRDTILTEWRRSKFLGQDLFAEDKTQEHE